MEEGNEVNVTKTVSIKPSLWAEFQGHAASKGLSVSAWFRMIGIRDIKNTKLDEI